MCGVLCCAVLCVCVVCVEGMVVCGTCVGCGVGYVGGGVCAISSTCVYDLQKEMIPNSRVSSPFVGAHLKHDLKGVLLLLKLCHERCVWCAVHMRYCDVQVVCGRNDG